MHFAGLTFATSTSTPSAPMTSRAARTACLDRPGRTGWSTCAGHAVTVGRVSQIENGELAGIDVLDRYVAALGGNLRIVADFGDEQIKVG